MSLVEAMWNLTGVAIFAFYILLAGYMVIVDPLGVRRR